MEMEQAAPTYVGAALRRLRDGYSWGSQRRSFALLRTTGARRWRFRRRGASSPYGLKAVT